MDLSGVIERVEGVVRTCGEPDPAMSELRAALRATTELQGFIAARRAELVTAIDAHPTSFAEATIAETSGCSLGTATKEKVRASTLDAATAVADALSDGAITTGHVDALTRAARNLDNTATTALFGDESLANAAATQSIAQFDAYVKRKAKALDRSNAEERLAHQRRATRLSTWTDNDGMYNLKGRFDPDLGNNIAKALAARTSAKFTETLPDTAPADPIERVQHLEALALADLIVGDGSSSTSGGPPLVVVDATQANGAGGPIIDWGIPIELPHSLLQDIFDVNDPDVVIVANGIILHAPGKLNMGRSTRLANRAQRRALQGLYSTCAIPGCAVHYQRCRLHHIIYWHHGGRTDLDNLLPVCQHHHTQIHANNWQVKLGANRQLTIALPDGQVLRTGPPKRSAA